MMQRCNATRIYYSARCRLQTQAQARTQSQSQTQRVAYLNAATYGERLVVGVAVGGRSHNHLARDVRVSLCPLSFVSICAASACDVCVAVV